VATHKAPEKTKGLKAKGKFSLLLTLRDENVYKAVVKTVHNTSLCVYKARSL